MTDERDKAQALTTFMGELFANADPTQSRGEKITVREMLDRGAAQIGTGGTLSAGTRADLLLAMANAYRGLRLSQQALPLAQEALKIKRATGAPAAELIQAMDTLAAQHTLRGEYIDAIALRQEAQALIDSSDQTQLPDWAMHREIELRNRELLGDAAPEETLAALDVLDAKLATLDGSASGNVRLNATETRANALNRAGRLEEAITAQRSAVALAQQHRSPAEALNTRHRLAAMLMSRDAPAAVALLEEIDRDTVRLLGPEAELRAFLLNDIGVGLQKMDEGARALDASAAALGLARQAFGEDNRYALQLAVSHGISLREMQRWQDAEALLRDVLPRLEARSAPGMDAITHAYALAALGEILLGPHARLSEAQALFTQAEAVMTPHAADVRVVYNRIMHGAADACLALGNPVCARDVAERFRASLDAAGEPEESASRKSLVKLVAKIPA